MKSFEEILNPRVIINSFIAGGLVLFGSFSSGEITTQSCLFAITGFGIAFLTQLKNDIKLVPTGKKGELGLFKFI